MEHLQGVLMRAFLIDWQVKNGHPTFEWRESIHANPEYTKKNQKPNMPMNYTAIPLYNLANFENSPKSYSQMCLET